MCRPVAFSDKISDPFVPVCPGGATRLDVCFLVGQISTDQVLSEVSMASTVTAFVDIVNLSHHLFSIGYRHVILAPQQLPTLCVRSFRCCSQAQFINSAVAGSHRGSIPDTSLRHMR